MIPALSRQREVGACIFCFPLLLAVLAKGRVFEVQLINEIQLIHKGFLKVRHCLDDVIRQEGDCGEFDTDHALFLIGIM